MIHLLCQQMFCSTWYVITEQLIGTWGSCSLHGDLRWAGSLVFVFWLNRVLNCFLPYNLLIPLLFFFVIPYYSIVKYLSWICNMHFGSSFKSDKVWILLILSMHYKKDQMDNQNFTSLNFFLPQFTFEHEEKNLKS